MEHEQISFFTQSLFASIGILLIGCYVIFLLLKRPDSDCLRPFLFPRSVDPENDLGRLMSWIGGVGFVLGGGFGIAVSVYEILNSSQSLVRAQNLVHMNYEKLLFFIKNPFACIVFILIGMSLFYLLIKKPDSDYLRLIFVPRSLDPKNYSGRFLSGIVGLGCTTVGGYGIGVILYEIITRSR